jgi:hypothetical protein
MSWKRLSALAAALALTAAFAGQALAQGDDDDRSRRIELGQRKVNMSNEKDVFVIGRGDEWWKDRGIRRLYLKAERGRIRLIAVRLHFKNPRGSEPYEDHAINQMLQEGQEQMIKLRGEKKYLEKVEFLYRAKADFDSAVVKLYGVLSRGGPEVEITTGPKGAWIDLGCKEVNLRGVDFDTIRVGVRDGSLRAIRLLGRGADIELRDVTVVYHNGERDKLRVRRVLRQGDRTGALDLEGRRRVIDRIELAYERIPNFRGQASLCAEGLR